MFLVPLDRRRGWYRYHALFREFLLGELRRVEPDVIAKLHLRAADWYESNGSPALALEHLLNTTERDRCVRLVMELAMPTYQSGQMSTVQRWFSTLGDSAVEEYPPLAVVAGGIAVLTGQTAEAQRWAALADTASFALIPVDGTASFGSSRAMFRATMCRDGPEQMVADASLAAAAEPPWSPWRASAIMLCAEAQLLLGDDDRATALFLETSAAAPTLGDVDTTILSKAELAVLAMDRGRWAEAAEHLKLALAAIDDYRLHDYAISVLAFAAAARLAVHRGTGRRRTASSRGRCEPGRHARSPSPISPYAYACNWPRRTRRSPTSATARHLLREIDDILLHRPALGALVDEVSDFARVYSSAQVTVAGGPPLSPAELRLLPYLQTHLTFKQIGERLFVSRNTVSSQVGSIYRKLGVSSRSDAVQSAMSIGLLGG